MPLRKSSRVAKRARSPLAVLQTNAAGDIVDFEEKYNNPPDANLLSLAVVADEKDEKENQRPPPKPRKKRGKYKPRLTTKQRTDILSMWISDSFDAPRILAHYALQGVVIPPSTLDSLLKRYRKEDRIELHAHRIVRRSKYTEDDYRQMANIQKANNKLTYDQVIAEWRDVWSRAHDGAEAPKPSHYTLHKAFQMFNMTSKNLEWVAEAQNDEAHINWREQYCTEAINWQRENLIFVDETGFNAHMHRRRGRSERGLRAHATEKNSAGYRINICAAVSPVQGLVMYKCILTSFGTREFAGFMQELLDTPLLQSRSCIICMDNVSWHHVDEVHDVLRAGAVEHRIKRVPSYSPQLNPIEYCFKIWKDAIKGVDQTTTTVSLQRQIDDAAPLITDRLVARCLDHVYRYYVHCRLRLPLDKFDPRLDEGGAVVMNDPVNTTDEKEEKE